jgi:serine protease Do
MQKKLITFFSLATLSITSGFIGAFSFFHFSKNNQKEGIIQSITSQNTTAISYVRNSPVNPAETDFVKASEVSRPAVVYIKGVSLVQRMPSFWDPFGSIGQVGTSGSGVIITQDGYIVTNNHVVKDVHQLEVILNNNKRSFSATIVGTDPSSDLALLKIEGKNLPHIAFANSDDVKIGSWVVAVGNPFNLTSTVTAGIVSAKGRNINIVHSQFPIESFIQTDAAINPGNSGGALVNIDGELVGINTAIQSESGVNIGYGFAIPSNIVKKVISDIKEYGYVQRAFIEAEVVDIDEKLASKIEDDNLNGVFVKKVFQGGNAEAGALQAGDIILKVDGNFIDTRSLFDEQLAFHRPGDKVKLLIQRGKERKDIDIILTNQRGNTSLEKGQTVKSKSLGAEFEEIPRLEREKLNVNGGIRVFNIKSGLIHNMNLPEGFIILNFNNKPYHDPAELINAMENAHGRVVVEGINFSGQRITYQFFMN